MIVEKKVDEKEGRKEWKEKISRKLYEIVIERGYTNLYVTNEGSPVVRVYTRFGTFVEKIHHDDGSTTLVLYSSLPIKFVVHHETDGWFIAENTKHGYFLDRETLTYTDEDFGYKPGVSELFWGGDDDVSADEFIHVDFDTKRVRRTEKPKW